MLTTPPEPLPKFDIEIAVLLYGDFPHLAERCLTPLVPIREAGVKVQVFANEPSAATLEVASRLGFYPEVFAPQLYKYPVMKKAIDRCGSKFFMWLDDDSVITAEDPVAWLSKAEWTAKSKFADLMGRPYMIPLYDSQIEWVKTRPWYKGLDVPKRVPFLQGGWWVARTQFLRDIDWPDWSLRHNGGDVMLGVACKQQQGRMVAYKDQDVIPNASYPDCKESRSPRRGYSELPVGWKKGSK